jgi:tRNA threonylcarbamoyladenosine biosynthesis protein TsaB
MKLHLDTSDNQKTVIIIDGRKFEYNYASPREQNVWGAISDVCRQLKIGPENLTSISVNTGPGSFTGLRVGVAIANALGMALNIPVNDQPPQAIIVPFYDKPPSITMQNK